MNTSKRRFFPGLAAALCFAIGIGCGGGSDSSNGAPLPGDSETFNGTPSTLFVRNLKKNQAVDVYVTFGGDSCITSQNIKIGGMTGQCLSANYGECVFTLAAGEKKEINLDLCRADLTFRFDSAEGCGVTKAEANMNVPNWDDAWNISLVDGWNANVQIDVDTADLGAKLLGPTVGATGNQGVFGVYPLGCDVCTARQVPPCGIAHGDSECKTPNGVSHQYSPSVPCQWNHQRPNAVTVSVTD